jgi:hypothetical protein
MDEFDFKKTVIRNCRRFVKNCYELPKSIDYSLLQDLESYGILQVQNFSAYNSVAKDTFKIETETVLQITGVLADKRFFLTLAKQNAEYEAEIENILQRWIQAQS